MRFKVTDRYIFWNVALTLLAPVIAALLFLLICLLSGCQTYRYLEYDAAGNLKRDGFAVGIVTKPAFNLEYEEGRVKLQYARENDLEGLGAAIGAGVRSAAGAPPVPRLPTTRP